MKMQLCLIILQISISTSSQAKSADANRNSQLAWLIELCDLERGGVVINDPPPTPVLSEGSETSATTCCDKIGKICQREANNLLNRLLTKSGKSGYTRIAV